MGIGSLVFEVSRREIKCWTSGKFDLLVAVDVVLNFKNNMQVFFITFSVERNTVRFSTKKYSGVYI